MLQELCRVCLITNLQEVNKKNAPTNQCTTVFSMQTLKMIIQLHAKKMGTVFDGKNPKANHLGCIKPCKSWDFNYHFVNW